ncbi:MAG TPA: hypothetical protein VGK10_01410 [Prolixibacteraceae bacterium]|jgi:hypothetical protein
MQNRFFRQVITIILISLLLGCVRAPNVPKIKQGEITLIPMVSGTATMGTSAIILTPAFQDQGTLLPDGSKTMTPIVPTIDPTYLVLPTVTPTPTIDVGTMLLRIVSPGPMSKIVSPLELIAHIAPGYTGVTRIELIGEDGAELYRRVFKTYSNIGYYTRIDEQIKFEIRGAAEIARLQISTFDSSGRLQAFNSVRLLLQAVGENEFYPANELNDRILMRYPKSGDEVSGPTLSVTGEFQPATDLPVVLELVDVTGKVLSSKFLQFSPTDGKYQQFTTSLPFEVLVKTPVRLVIRQSDDRISGLVYLFSQEIILSPK